MALSMQMKPAKQRGGEEEATKKMILEQKVTPGDFIAAYWGTTGGRPYLGNFIGFGKFDKKFDPSGVNMHIFLENGSHDDGQNTQNEIVIAGSDVALSLRGIAGIVKISPGDKVSIDFIDGPMLRHAKKGEVKYRHVDGNFMFLNVSPEDKKGYISVSTGGSIEIIPEMNIVSWKKQ